MPAERRVLVTRPAGQADGLIAGLQGLGLDAVHIPMLELRPSDPLPGAERQRILDLDLYDDLVFISANAARFGLAAIHDYWPQYPTGQTIWAVGASTAEVLEAAGLTATFPETDMSSEGLLALPGLQDLARRRVLIVKGEGGREKLREELAARGARVDTLSCYTRAAPDHDGAALRRQLMAEPVALILISSGEGLENLSRLLHPRENTNLADTALIVPSSRVAEQSAALGWRTVRQAENASDAAMLAAVDAWAGN